MLPEFLTSSFRHLRLLKTHHLRAPLHPRRVISRPLSTLHLFLPIHQYILLYRSPLNYLLPNMMKVGRQSIQSIEVRYPRNLPVRNARSLGTLVRHLRPSCHRGRNSLMRNYAIVLSSLSMERLPCRKFVTGQVSVTTGIVSMRDLVGR